MKGYYLLLIFIVCLFFYPCLGNTEGEKAEESPAVPSSENISREELVAEISRELETADNQVLAMVPGLTRTTGEDEKMEYALTMADGTVKKVKELDKDLLNNLLSKVRQGKSLLQFQKMQLQLKNLKAIQDIQRAQKSQPKIPSVSRSLTTIPRNPTTTQPPRVYKPPPRVYTPPPAPPRQGR